MVFHESVALSTATCQPCGLIVEILSPAVGVVDLGTLAQAIGQDTAGEENRPDLAGGVQLEENLAARGILAQLTAVLW